MTDIYYSLGIKASTSIVSYGLSIYDSSLVAYKRNILKRKFPYIDF